MARIGEVSESDQLNRASRAISGIGFEIRDVYDERAASSRPLQQFPINVGGLRIKAREHHPLDSTGVTSNFGHRDLRRPDFWKSVDARADGWEGDAFDAQLSGDLLGPAITKGQQFILTGIPAAPDWADGVNYVSRSQFVSFGRFRITRFAPSEQTALRQQIRACGSVNRPVYAAPAQKGAIGRVDDCVYA
jgi:hypothetical protein